MTALAVLTVRLSVLTLASLLAAFGANTVGELAIDFDFGDLRLDEAELLEHLTVRD